MFEAAPSCSFSLSLSKGDWNRAVLPARLSRSDSRNLFKGFAPAFHFVRFFFCQIALGQTWTGLKSNNSWTGDLGCLWRRVAGRIQ